MVPVYKMPSRLCWYQNGRYHRDNDLPALISRKVQKWFKNGQLHRDNDKPAVVRTDGRQCWFHHGKLHRSGDKPAQVWPDGKQWFYVHGKLHRDGDQPAQVWPNGTQKYYVNGKLHREGNRPAVIFSDGRQIWYWHGRAYHFYINPIAGVLARAELDPEYIAAREEFRASLSRQWALSGQDEWPTSRCAFDVPEDTICLITHDLLDRSKSFARCGGCQKFFTYELLRLWLRSSKSCPACRREWMADNGVQLVMV